MNHPFLNGEVRVMQVIGPWQGKSNLCQLVKVGPAPPSDHVVIDAPLREGRSLLAFRLRGGIGNPPPIPYNRHIGKR
jgi:hypothetical protein